MQFYYDSPQVHDQETHLNNQPTIKMLDGPKQTWTREERLYEIFCGPEYRAVDSFLVAGVMLILMGNLLTFSGCLLLLEDDIDVS